MPATSSWARRISVSTSWVAARLAGYSTCQAIQRLPIGSGKLSIFRSTWSTLWTPISGLSACRKKREREWIVKQVAWKKKSVCGCRDLCVLVSSFNPVSGLMTTNGKGWWMCLRWISMTFYQLRFSKMPSPFVYDSLFNSLLYGISSRPLYIPLTLYSRWCAM